MLQILGYEQKGQWGRAWDRLITEHRAVVDKTQFSDCLNQKEGIPGDVTFDVSEVYDETVDVPGVGERDTKAVTWTASAGGESASRTSHVMEESGQWRWILGPSELDAYKSGECPT